ncbi:MAG: GTPase [Lachnospiraceae bacterium]|nr:GTPase [Lachnospiraceae bacterium]
MAEVPVYVVTGFLEAGKTDFIRTTLEDPSFVNKDRILLVVCEEGIEEYDTEAFAKRGIFVETVEGLDELTEDFYKQAQSKHRPDKVIFELNGTWKMDDFMETPTPQEWVFVQFICIVNAETFSNYLTNMRSMIMEQIKYSDTVIFNRCTRQTDRVSIRRTIKPLNRKAQIIYEAKDGEELGEEEEEPLPFDISGDRIVIEDDDFGLFYLDALDNPGHYTGKVVCFKAQYYHDEKMGKGLMLPGRFAMQCCADDIGFVGFIARLPFSLKDYVATVNNRDWIYVEAEFKVEMRREYRGKGPVLYVKSLKAAERAEEEVVYFT